MKPFCALLHTLLMTLSNLVFRAREIILYIFDRREIGLQFLMEATLPFLGMSLMLAPLKLPVSSPTSKNRNAYLSKGLLRKVQHFFIAKLLKPSIPAADQRLHFLSELSSSSSVKTASRAATSPTFSLDSKTIGSAQMRSPKKFSTT